MGLGGFIRSLTPGNDTGLAEDIATERRNQRSRSATKAARDGQDWEDADRRSDAKGDRHTDWINGKNN
jgi:hypothetical protein